MKRVVVLGQGYVGLPLAMRAVARGYTVVGIDVDQARIADLQAGRSYIEDIDSSEIVYALSTGRFSASASVADAAGFDIAVITVPTPLSDGLPDLSYIEAAGTGLGAHLRPGCTVILESTTYPGTTEELLAPVLEQQSGLSAGLDFDLGYSPERIDPGNADFQFENTPKVVSGVNARSLTAVESFYDSLIERTVPVSSCRIAELTKLIENTFRHVNIALVNELAMFAHDLDIDIWEAIEASSTKPFGFMQFSPGPGVGGHCLPIDPSYLSWRVKRQLGMPFRFVELANDINDHMPDYVVRRVATLLNRRRKAINGSKILLLGLAYKKNSADARESPAVRVYELLAGLGAELTVVDPHVVALRSSMEITVERTLRETDVLQADLVVVLTDHDYFDYALVAKADAVLDTRSCNILDAEVL